MAAPIIDDATINDLRTTTDAEFVSELVDTYCEETPRLIAQLKEALAQGECDTFRRLAHSIKSSSNSLGALGLGAQARELEMMGKAGDLSAAPAKVSALAKDYDAVERALRTIQHAN